MKRQIEMGKSLSISLYEREKQFPPLEKVRQLSPFGKGGLRGIWDLMVIR